MVRTKQEWKEFEQAVAVFAAALDRGATVKHNVSLPDRHHLGRRQRDVWIEAKVCGHFPVSVLVSCKRFRRKLHSGDIDAFNGELASSNARLGVIYSYSGFTKPAIQKARVLGLPCCRLYMGQGPEIPKALAFAAYCCYPRIALSLSPYPAAGWNLETWQDVFDLTIERAAGPSTLLDELVARYHDAERVAVGDAGQSGQVPQPFQAEVLVPGMTDSRVALRVMANGAWRLYRAKVEAYVVNGSYEFTHGDFKGQIATPAVDRFAAEPGPGWERVESATGDRRILTMMILHQGNTRNALLENLGSARLANGV